MKRLLAALLLLFVAGLDSQPPDPRPKGPCPTDEMCAQLCLGEENPWGCFDNCISDDTECL